MKYSKEWRHSVNQMPPNLKDVCVDYKKWKTQCRNLSMTEALVLLGNECVRVENTFNNSYQEWRQPPSMLSCLTRSKSPYNPSTLLTFAQANAKTVYKICKRLQKTNANPTPMQWLISIRAAHEFNFLGGHHTTLLQMWGISSSECPLCFNAVQKKHMLIYHCGHNACISCTLRYAKVNENGMWYHVLPHAHRKDCPFCHFQKAFINATTIE